MPLVKGFILIAYFSITWGVFTAINAALLLEFARLPEGLLSFVLSVGFGFLENLALWAILARLLGRIRQVDVPAQERGPGSTGEKDDEPFGAGIEESERR